MLILFKIKERIFTQMINSNFSIIKSTSFKNMISQEKQIATQKQSTSNEKPQLSNQKLQSKPNLTILHFNDVYDIQTKKGIGGIYNFKAMLQDLKQKYQNNCLLLFSGDAFSPSILSRTKKGWQMVKALNSLKIDVACYGNHEFDFEEQHTIKLSQACNFPWLLGNIKCIKTGRILGNGIPYIIKTLENGLKIGIFGVAGKDWISIMSEEYQGLFKCQDVENYCVDMSQKLKRQEKCDFIIALTHMRNGDDMDLAQVPSQIDIILGGHDHVIMNRCIKKTPIIKSGSNFHQLGVIQVYTKSQQAPLEFQEDEDHSSKTQYKKKIYKGKNYNFVCQVHSVPIAKENKIDQDLKAYVDRQVQEYKKIDRIVGYAECALQARFRVIRAQESNYGNFFADLFRYYYHTDIAVCNSGCIRNDLLLPAGPIKLSKLTNIIDDKVIVKSVPGSAIYKMLQYAVKGLPHSFMGSFLLVSGIRFTYNLKKTPKIQSIQCNGEPVDLNKEYTIAMPSYLGNGADGFDFIKPYHKIVDQVRGTTILSVLLIFFNALDDNLQDYQEKYDCHSYPNSSSAKKISRIKKLRTNFFITENGQKVPCIKPKVQGRVICLNEQN